MTETLTTTREQTRQVRGRAGRLRILVAALLAGALVSGAVFAVSQPSHQEVEQAYWDQVVDYYEQYQTARSNASAEPAGVSGSIEQAHWAAVVDY